jgi:hypothetical protein
MIICCSLPVTVSTGIPPLFMNAHYFETALVSPYKPILICVWLFNSLVSINQSVYQSLPFESADMTFSSKRHVVLRCTLPAHVYLPIGFMMLTEGTAQNILWFLFLSVGVTVITVLLLALKKCFQRMSLFPWLVIVSNHLKRLVLYYPL